MKQNEVEEILRRKYYNENLLNFHNETAVTATLSNTPPYRTGESKIEKKAVAIADAKREMKIINLVLNLCTEEQKDFITQRYFEDRDIKDITGIMSCSKRKLYVMRDKILNDSLKLLNM